LWQSFSAFAENESEFEPPASVVRQVKAAMVLEPALASNNPLQAIAQLVFDSFLQPLPMGIRSSAYLKRYLLYKYESLIIDLAVESGTSSEKQLVVGQVTDCKSRNLSGVKISLVSGKRKVAATQANGFGEFFLEFEKTADSWISFTINDSKEIVIPIGETLKNPS